MRGERGGRSTGGGERGGRRVRWNGFWNILEEMPQATTHVNEGTTIKLSVAETVNEDCQLTIFEGGFKDFANFQYTDLQITLTVS